LGPDALTREYSMRGRLSTVDLLIKGGLFCKKVNILKIKGA
jgi:hypothetical protein